MARSLPSVEGRAGTPSLTVEEKFLGVDQGPDQVFEPLAGLALGASPRQVGQADVALVVGRKACIAEAIQLLDLIGVGPRIGRPPAGPVPRSRQLLLDLGRV